MKIEIEDILGKWKLFKMQNDQGMEVHVLNYGGIITKITAPNQNGEFENVVLSYKDMQDYESNPHFLGAMIGRVAGRIKNAEFNLNGEHYDLESNDGQHHLHSGSNGFHHKIWRGETFQTEQEVGIRLSYVSPDGDNGYPGTVKVVTHYTLTNDNQLILDYRATTDKTTPLTLTNHSYFNLSGNLQETIHQHQINMNSNQFVALDDELIPTGEIVDVDNTPAFDFRQGRFVGEGLTHVSAQNKIVGDGYDHYFIFDQNGKPNVSVKHEKSGRTMVVETTQPGMVMYTSNNLEDTIPLAAGVSRKYLGICFETQGSPASLHHESFPGIVLKPEETYKQQTTFTFKVDDLL